MNHISFVVCPLCPVDQTTLISPTKKFANKDEIMLVCWQFHKAIHDLLFDKKKTRNLPECDTFWHETLTDADLCHKVSEKENVKKLLEFDPFGIGDLEQLLPEMVFVELSELSEAKVTEIREENPPSAGNSRKYWFVIYQ